MGKIGVRDVETKVGSEVFKKVIVWKLIGNFGAECDSSLVSLPVRQIKGVHHTQQRATLRMV